MRGCPANVHVRAGEAPVVILPLMAEPLRPRRRLIELHREADRLSTALALTLGQAVRARRKRMTMTQAVLADQVHVSQVRVSQVERGLGRGVPLDLWVVLGLALEQPLSITFSRPLDSSREPIDAGHLAMQERLLELARATGRRGTFELPTRPADPRHSIDVCVRDSPSRLLMIEEAWNTFGDLGAAVRSTNRKVAEARDIAAIIDDGPPYRVATVWVLRATAANRALVSRYPHIFRSAFPGSSRAWVRALTTIVTPPAQPGLVWLDPASGRISEWRANAQFAPGR